jgi:hypothetical protein
MCKWISVDEQLPELNKLVLCCGKKGGLFVGRVYNLVKSDDGETYAYWDVPNSRTYREPIYWMEIPETPV